MKRSLIIMVLALALIGSGTLVFAQDGSGGGVIGAGSENVTSNNDCTGGQCGAEIDYCSTSGAQCYTPQYCTEYNTPRVVSPLSVSTEVGQSFQYEVMVAQVDPNPSRSLAPWEHPLIHERLGSETGWYGENLTAVDAGGLSGSGLSSNAASVITVKRYGVPQTPNATGLFISGTPSAPGTYLVPITTRNDLKEWLYGGGDNQSSTGAGVIGEYVNRSASCSSAAVLEIRVGQCSAGAPTITSPDIVTGKVGVPFSFRATATGHTSLSAGADRLPPGTSWDAPLSVTGVPTAAGTYPLFIYAEGCGEPASKNVIIQIEPSDECSALEPPFVITSAGSASAEIGALFSGYTIQTSYSADSYLIEPASGDTFPASLGVVNNNRSLEGSIAASQPKQQYHFVVRATKNLTSTTSCSVQKPVTLGLSCPGARPHWNPSTGECQSEPICADCGGSVCTNTQATNYGQPGECVFGTCTGPNCGSSSGGGSGSGGGGYVCADPLAENFGRPGSCQPRSGCGAGETGSPPSCSEIPCPSCGQTKTCNVCVETNDNGACIQRDTTVYEAKSAPNTCGLTRSLYYCHGESSEAPPPPGEEACTKPDVAVNPARELVQKGGQCTVPWGVSGVPAAEREFLRCVLSGPQGFAVRLNGTSGSVLTLPVEIQSLFTLRCRNGIAKLSDTAQFTCRVSPRFEER